MTELRCASKLHAVLDVDGGYIKIKCSSRFCGAGPGVVIIHRFDAATGQFVETDRYRDPVKGNINE